MSKTKKVIEQSFSMYQMLDIFECVIRETEKRITDRVMEKVKVMQPPPWPAPSPLSVESIRADRIKQVPFRTLIGGCAFRLDTGSQPIMKLDTSQHWNREMPHHANAFYLRTGSTTYILPDKLVVPLKCNLTVDEA